MKDLGHFCYFFGIEVSFDGNGYYVTDILSCANLSNNKTVNALLERNVKLCSNILYPSIY